MSAFLGFVGTWGALIFALALAVLGLRGLYRPSEATVDPTLAHISHVADALTMTLGLGIGADGLAYCLDDASIAALKLDRPGVMDALLARLTEQLFQAEDLLKPPSPAQ